MNTNVINLENRMDRYEKVSSIFSNINSIKINRFNALKGNPGWKYCGLSHQEIIKNNLNCNKNLLVLEDDCDIYDIKNFDNRWSEIKKWLDNNLDKWDIFNGGPTFVERNKYVKILDEKLNIIQVKIARTSNFVYYNKNILNKILNWNPDNNIPIDNFDEWCPELKIVTSIPFLSSQYESYSDIVGQVLNNNIRFAISQQHIYNCIKRGKLHK